MKAAVNFSCLSAITLMVSLSGCKNSPVDGAGLMSCLQENFSRPEKKTGKIIARIDEIEITDLEFKEEFDKLGQQARPRLPPAQMREAFLNNLIDRKVLAQLAQKAGVDRQPAYRLKLQSLKEILLSQFYREDIIKRVPASDAEVLKYLEGSVEIAASHIVLPTFAEANRAKSLLKAGRPFAVVAKTMSIDVMTASKGGKMGYIWTGRASPMTSILVKLKDGQVSDIIETPFGFEIFRRDGTKRSGAPSREMKEDLRHRAEWTYFAEHLNKAKESMKIEVDKAALAAAFPDTDVSHPATDVPPAVPSAR